MYRNKHLDTMTFKRMHFDSAGCLKINKKLALSKQLIDVMCIMFLFAC